MSKRTPNAPSITTRLPHTAPPGPRGHLLLGVAGDFQRDPLGFFSALTRQYGDIVHYRFVFWPVYQISHPDDVKRVFHDNYRNYDKDTFFYKPLRPFLGQGLITNDGDSWLKQRRLMQPAFHRQRLASFGQLMSDATLAMLDRWQMRAQREQPLDIADEMMRLTLRIVGQALFNIDLSNETDALGQSFTRLSKLMRESMLSVPIPLSIPTRRNRSIKTTIHTLDAIMYGIISERRKLNTDTGDLLSMLLEARDKETGDMMNDQQLRDEMITLLFAGHETTANALAWTWYLLSQHPEVERRLHVELDEVLAGQRPSVEHLPHLPYSRMVLDEALRLYPPLYATNRKAIADDELRGYHIPANSMIMVCPYLTHRHPAFWEQPERFDPERFTPQRSAGRPEYAYFPFFRGPRMCIGNNFALMEAQLVLATIAQHYQLRLVPGHLVEPEPLLTLRPRGGLPMTLHEISRLQPPGAPSIGRQQ